MIFRSSMEVWADIPDYVNIYEVSNFGRIRTKQGKTTYTKNGKPRVWKQRILKQKTSNKVTGCKVVLWKDRKPKDFLVARLVAFTFYGVDINDKTLTVDHVDGDRFNNKLQNLQLVTLKENINRAYELGLCKQQQIVVESLETGEKRVFRSYAQASRFIGKYNGYISYKMKNNKKSDDKYKWYHLEETL